MYEKTIKNLNVIQTLKPDERGRINILQHLKLIGWQPGQGVKVMFMNTIELPKTEK